LTKTNELIANQTNELKQRLKETKMKEKELKKQKRKRFAERNQERRTE
jgi:hypothetical protein